MSVARLLAYHAALNAIELDAVAAMFAETAEYVSPGLNGVVRGRAAIMEAMGRYFSEYADQHSRDDEVVALSPHVVQSLWSLRATSSKTGKVLIRHGKEVVTFDDSGLISKVEVFDAG
jgi:hypothetical protein